MVVLLALISRIYLGMKCIKSVFFMRWVLKLVNLGFSLKIRISVLFGNFWIFERGFEFVNGCVGSV